MSADNNAACPRCLRAAEAALKGAYGKVLADRYDRLREVVDTVLDDCNLRECWELGTNAKGVLKIDYYCSCDKCGLKFSFKHQVNVLRDQ